MLRIKQNGLIGGGDPIWKTVSNPGLPYNSITKSANDIIIYVKSTAFLN